MGSALWSIAALPRKAETPSVTVTASRGPSLALIDSYREQLAELLNAIGVVESLSCDDAVGDNGPSTVPSQISVEHFTNQVAPMLTACEQLRVKVLNLRRTRDLLLPRLLSGQINLEAMPA